MESASKILKKNIFIVVLFLGGALMLIVGALQFFSKPVDSGIKFESSEKSDEAKNFFVDISGAVKNPGLYEFSSDQRIGDAITSAGGFLEDANQEYINKNLNQAQILSDGIKIYIPFEGEEITEVLGQSDVSQGGAMSLNSAAISQLEELPRIGPVTAQKIIDGRPYESVDDLLIRKIVSASVFDQIKDLVTP